VAVAGELQEETGAGGHVVRQRIDVQPSAAKASFWWAAVPPMSKRAAAPSASEACAEV
jgi:hypothetical protein